MKHKKIIQQVFSHPVSTNIDWKSLQHALEHYGAKVELTKSNKAKVFYQDKEAVFSLPHHGHEINNKDEVIAIRHFLEEVGLTPDSL